MLRYVLFAVIAIAANLAAQALLFMIYAGPLRFAGALTAGTIVGLVVKFELDRRLIFYAPQADIGRTGMAFLSYASTGVITTAIFWVTETIFYLASGKVDGSQYVGGLVGLTIGYLLKYRLDKRYVFRS